MVWACLITAFGVGRAWSLCDQCTHCSARESVGWIRYHACHLHSYQADQSIRGQSGRPVHPLLHDSSCLAPGISSPLSKGSHLPRSPTVRQPMQWFHSQCSSQARQSAHSLVRNGFERAKKEWWSHFSFVSVEGKSRSPSIACIYLMTVTGLSWSETINSVRGVRTLVDPNFAFQRQLKHFSDRLVQQVNQRMYFFRVSKFFRRNANGCSRNSARSQRSMMTKRSFWRI